MQIQLKLPNELAEFAQFYIECIAESDRGLLLMCHGQLDNALKELFEAEFASHGTTPSDIKWLLSGKNRPLLQSFHAKAKLASALGLLEARTCNALVDLNSIRIDAAHLPAPFRITEAKVESLLVQLAPTRAKRIRSKANLVLKIDKQQLQKRPDDAKLPWYKGCTKPRVMLIQFFMSLSGIISNKTEQLAKRHKSRSAP